MAIYPYKCLECGRTEEVIQSIASYSQAPKRPTCCFGTDMLRIITAPMMSIDLQSPYVSPIDGSVITSRAEQKEHMQKHGVVHYDEIAPDIERNRKARQAAAVADIKQDLIDSVHRIEHGYKPQVIPEAELIPT